MVEKLEIAIRRTIKAIPKDKNLCCLKIYADKEYDKRYEKYSISRRKTGDYIYNFEVRGTDNDFIIKRTTGGSNKYFRVKEARYDNIKITYRKGKYEMSLYAKSGEWVDGNEY